ncbi:MAG: cytochrome c biogenesis protein CcsA [Candidatus Accumulibacter sp.]|jgi:ABC-type uncharacterized transport system permease subunit|nr:cytochrome c biogenesis protein CcsA [Accumulibacter sp.]
MPDILSHLLPPIAAALLYAGLGYHFWHTRWNDAGKPPEPLPMRPWERRAIAAALLLQGAGLYGELFSGGGLRFSFSLAASLMLWLAVLIHWLESFASRMDGMQPMVLPLAAISAALPVAFPQTHEIVYAQALGFRMHFLAAMLSYSLVTLSALHAVFMGIIGHKLHRRDLRAPQASLPSILSMESLLFRMIGVAFLLLTLTLASGLAFSFSERAAGKALLFDHKIFFAFSSWLIYAALLFGRYRYGWRGRIALRWTLAGFLLLILAYIGNRFVLEVLLDQA